MGGRKRILVMTDTRDEKGMMWRAVSLSAQGHLSIEGHGLTGQFWNRIGD